MRNPNFIIIVISLIIALTACGTENSSSQTLNEEANTNTQTHSSCGTEISRTESSNPEKSGQNQVKTFSVKPVEGWGLVEGSQTETFKAYTILEPYIGTGAFWLEFVENGILDAKEQALMDFFNEKGWKGVKIQNLDKVTVGKYKGIRCVITSDLYKGQTQAHYFIDIEGDQDIYFQLSAPNEEYEKAQTAWEEALKTLIPKYKS